MKTYPHMTIDHMWTGKFCVFHTELLKRILHHKTHTTHLLENRITTPLYSLTSRYLSVHTALTEPCNTHSLCENSIQNHLIKKTSEHITRIYSELHKEHQEESSQQMKPERRIISSAFPLYHISRSRSFQKKTLHTLSPILLSTLVSQIKLPSTFPNNTNLVHNLHTI